MNKQVEYGIQGAFKVDLFSGGQFVSSTDYFSNFITPTGLMYPNNYAFADCFRFLSLGRSSASHSGAVALNEMGTTGLSDAIASYTTSLGNTQSAQYIGWEGYATGKASSNCGTALSETGPRFYRAWYIPTGREEVSINEPAGGGLMIGEFMVSPSSGEHTTGKYAFSRVVRNLFIPNGFRAIVSYQLKVNIKNTGITFFSGGSFNTGSAEISNDAALVATWASLSGYYRQIYHGLRCIDNLGLTYIPKYGDGMEPASSNVSKMVWYLSPDNSQFDVNRLSGGFSTSVASAYQADGLMAHLKSLDFKTSAIAHPSWESLDKAGMTALYNSNSPDYVDTFPTALTLTNIRIGSSSSKLVPPDTRAYKTYNADNAVNFQSKTESVDVASKTISYATPGKNGWSDFYSDFGKQAAFTSNSTKLPLIMTGQNQVTGRKKTVTRKSTFSPVSSLGYNTRFASMVYAYEAISTDEGNKTYYPVLDTLFFDTSGRSLMGHYRYISGIQLTERGSGILEASIYLSGQIGSNIFRFSPRNTFQGPYSSPMKHALMQSIVWQDNPDSPTVFKYAGFAATGTFNSDATSGTTGLVVVNGASYYQGWGSIYGVSVNSGFYDYKLDVGIVNRNLSNLTAPDFTGQLYWPVIAPENAIKLCVTGVKFYHPDLGTGILDNSGWYGQNQIVQNINFDVQNPSFTAIPGVNYLKNVTGVLAGATDLCSGYYITRKRYFNNVIELSDMANAGNFLFTGYVIPIDRNIGNNKLKGGIWDDGGTLPIDRLAFVPAYTNTTFSGSPSFRKVTQLFTGVTDRGYPFGTGGSPLKQGDRVYVFFSGFSGGGSTVPLYLTMVSGSGNSAMGFSYLSGAVTLSSFASPTGYPYHGENSGDYGWKLLPNHAPAVYYGEEPVYYPPTTGGEYPALSLDNGLEMYLDISWSSPCGPDVKGGTCNEPI